jgi:hypothetical protein
MSPQTGDSPFLAELALALPPSLPSPTRSLLWRTTCGFCGHQWNMLTPAETALELRLKPEGAPPDATEGHKTVQAALQAWAESETVEASVLVAKSCHALSAEARRCATTVYHLAALISMLL